MKIFLYVKQHSVTGLKYFGKTTKNNAYNYNGSGKYWKRHLKIHGNEHVVTLKVFEFETQELATSFAINFSKENNIVESKEWANLQEENAIDGWSKNNLRGNQTLIHKQRNSIAHIGKKRGKLSENWKKNLSESRKNKTVYTFLNTNTKEQFVGTQYDFYSYYSLNKGNVSRLITGDLKTVKKWVIYK